IQGRRRVLDPRNRADLPALRAARQAGSGEGLMAGIDQQPSAENRPVGAQLDAESRGTAPLKVEARDPNGFMQSVKDAGMAAFLTGVLGLFFLALRSDIAPGGLALTTRWGLWITAIAIVFAGRLALNLFVFKSDRPVTGALGRAIARTGEKTSWLGWWLSRLLFAVALFLPFLIIQFFPAQDRQLIDLAILIMTYIMLG